MSKNFGLRKSGMQKQSEPVTPQFTQCHTTQWVVILFSPHFLYSYGNGTVPSIHQMHWPQSESQHQPQSPFHRHPPTRRAKESQLDGLFLYASPYSEFGVLGECVVSPTQEEI